MKKDIIIYGTGKYGMIIYNFLKSLGEINILCFLETKVDEERTYDGIPVLPVDILLKRSTEDVVILIAIKSPKIWNSVRLILLEYGIRNSQIILCSDFIEDNNLNLFRKRFCICCNHYVNTFLPSGIKQQIFKKYHIIGGGYRDNCICPNCSSNDRERWLYYILYRHTKILSDMCTVLHFAPEKRVFKKIAADNPACQYLTADIVSGRAQYAVDMTNIGFEDNVFDYVIANHVLEHISDEQKAVSEIKRVLKPNGMIILSFPICMDIDTLEDKTLVTEKERLEIYGQIDHVRLYGKDYRVHFEEYGFNVQVFSPYMEFSDEEITEMGFLRDDIILICSMKKSR